MSEILYKFCAFSVPNSVRKIINTQETQKNGSEIVSLDRNFWPNFFQILDQKVSENGTESRILSSVNRPLKKPDMRWKIPGRGICDIFFQKKQTAKKNQRGN